MRPPSASYGRRWRAWIDDGQVCRRPQRVIRQRVLGACCATSVFARLDCRSPAPFDWPARNGESTQPRCQTSAATCAFHCVTMTRNPMRRRVRASYSRPKLRAGACTEDRLTIRAAMASCRGNRMGEIYNFAPQDHQMPVLSKTRSTPSDGLILRWMLAGSRRS